MVVTNLSNIKIAIKVLASIFPWKLLYVNILKLCKKKNDINYEVQKGENLVLSQTLCQCSIHVG